MWVRHVEVLHFKLICKLRHIEYDILDLHSYNTLDYHKYTDTYQLILYLN